MARTGGPGAGGISAFAVRAGSPGLSFGAPEAKMGWHAQPTRQVVLDEVPVPAGQRIGAEGDGFRMAMRALNGGRLNIAACSLGGAQEALDRTVRYLGQREAFGAPLAESSALQFRLADMATELEAGRMLLWRAADALDADEPRAPVLCAMAKRFCTDAGFEVANEALQLHGGYGYLAAYGIEKIVRDLRVHQIVEGTNEIMRRIVARELVGTAR
jgi:alkylation response protein AidB-like acyl-CoA dehydrogenase